MIASDAGPDDLLKLLWDRGVTSVLVEGGAELLRAFIDAGLYDAARTEVASLTLGASGAAPAPSLR